MTNWKKIWPFFILAAVAVYFAFSWIPNGKYIGGGDVGIPFYRPGRALNIIFGSWWDTQATGTVNPVTYTAVPFYAILTLLNYLGVGTSLIQKSFFFLIVLCSSISVYALAKHFLLPVRYSFFAAFFYISNVFTLTIWRRGVHNGMLFLLLAPLTLFLLVKGLSKKNYYYILLINIVSVILSYVYGSPAYLMAIWFLWLLYLLVEFFSVKSGDAKKFVLKFAFLFVISWLGINLWWILHFVVSSLQVFGNLSLETLKNVSTDVLTALRTQTDLYYVLRGMDKYQLYDVEDWRYFYSTRIVLVASWITPILVVSTTLFERTKKSKLWRFLILLFVFTVFISKGTNPPLGWLTKYLYDKLFFLTLLRNPYEKVGPLMLLPFSMLFACALLNLDKVLTKIPKVIRLILPILILIVVSFVLAWPLWLGMTFSGSTEKAKIAVPGYYSQANEWLKSVNKNERILHLPVSPGESVDYDWGYSGVEPSQLFFDGSSISYHVGLETVDKRVSELEQFVRRNESTLFSKAISSLNIGWVILHEETEWKNRRHDDPARIKRWLKEDGLFEFKEQFGPLSIWKVDEKYVRGSVYTSKSIVFENVTKTQKLTTSWNKINPFETVFVNNTNKMNDNIKSFRFNSSRYLEYRSEPQIDGENALKELTYVRWLPGDYIYPFILLKEKLVQATSTTHPVRLCLDIAGKRLVETVYLKEKGLNTQAEANIDRYIEQIEKCRAPSGLTMEAYIGYLPRFTEVSENLWRHLIVMEKYLTGSEIEAQVTNADSKLRSFMSFYGISPRYNPRYEISDRKVVIFTFNIIDDGKYLIKLSSNSASSGMYNFSIEQIDDEMIHLKPITMPNEAIVFGEVELAKGEHEIHLSFNKLGDVELGKPELDNLATILADSVEEDTYQLKSSDRVSTISYSLSSVGSSEPYEISFESFVIRGDPVKVSVIQDSDPLNIKGKVMPALTHQLEPNNYDYYWQKNLFRYYPNLNASSAKIIFEVHPWNNCRTVYSEKDCNNKTIYENFNRQSEVWIRNFKVSRIFSENLFLEGEHKPGSDLGGALVSSQKITPGYYEVRVQDQKVPYVLVFTETQHPFWKIFDETNNEISLETFTANGYSNAWYVDRPLPEKIYIKFDLERLKYIGIVLSVAFLITTSTVILKMQKRK